MPEISRRRTDQFGDFMTVLKLSAVDLNDAASIPEERLRGGFHRARFPGTSGTNQKDVTLFDLNLR